jgi:ABC-type transport system substrate-binding protein
MPTGFECTMIAPNNRYVNDEKIAEAVVSMLAKINIKVNLKTMPKAQYWDEFDAQVADIQMIGWHSDTEDSGNFYEFLSCAPTRKPVTASTTAATTATRGGRTDPGRPERNRPEKTGRHPAGRSSRSSTTKPPSCPSTGRTTPTVPRKT